MDEKVAKVSLIIFIVGIFTFIGLFSWFMIFKEEVCAINLNTPQCGEKFPAFLHNEF
jgi:hypothetical protein